jgi:hypothetical protein
LKETLPTVIEATTRVISQKYLIFLYEERSEKFYVIEKLMTTLSDDVSFTIDSFLSNFLPFLERTIEIGKTFPGNLKEYMENLKYFSKFPRFISIRNRILKVEPKLRESIRKKLYEKVGAQWKDKILERNPNLVRKCENILKKRIDKEKAKDFLDGMSLGELISILEIFPKIFDLEENIVKGFLNILIQHRNLLEHPLEEPKEDIDEKTFKSLTATLDYIENVICT